MNWILRGRAKNKGSKRDCPLVISHMAIEHGPFTVFVIQM